MNFTETLAQITLLRSRPFNYPRSGDRGVPCLVALPLLLPGSVLVMVRTMIRLFVP